MFISPLALAAALSAAPRIAHAFAPALSPIRFHHSPSSTRSCRQQHARSPPWSLGMVGGGMIEPPRDGSPPPSSSDLPAAPSPSDDDSDLDLDSSSESNLKTRMQEYGASFERLADVYRTQLLDGGDMEPMIPPRPGAFEWTDDELRDEFDDEDMFVTNIDKRWKKDSDRDSLIVRDEKIALRGKLLSDSEREENLKALRRLRNSDIPMLVTVEDLTGYKTAQEDFNERERSDPWFDLNDRLGVAVQTEDNEEAVRLRAIIETIGGPPPQLVEAAKGPRGYCTPSEVMATPSSAERLEWLLDIQEWEDDQVTRREEKLKTELDKARRKREGEGDLEHIYAELRKQAEDSMDSESIRMSDMNRSVDKARKEEEEKRKEVLARFEGKDDPDWFSYQTKYINKLGDQFREGFKRSSLNEFEGEKEDPKMAFLDGDAEVGAGAEKTSGDDAASEDGGDDDSKYADRPMSKAAKARAEAMKNDGSGRPRLPGDADVTRGEIDADATEVNESSKATTGPLRVEVSSTYNAEQSDPPMRKHCFQYTVRITNESDKDTVQLLSRRFEIQTVGSSLKDVVQGEGVTGRQPVLKPGEVFEYTSTAPLSVRPIGTTEIAARMSGEYRYCTLEAGQDKATDEQANEGKGEAGAELATFHFVFPEEQRVKPVRPTDEDEDDDEDDDDTPAMKTTAVVPPTKSAGSASSSSSSSTAAAETTAPTSISSPPSLPGDADMTSGELSSDSSNDSSDTLTSDVRVVVTSTYRPERSDTGLDKHCFAYNVKITNEVAPAAGAGAESEAASIQLVSRRFEIQTVGSSNKDVVQGPGVTGRQPVLRPGESFEYTSTAPLSVRPLGTTKVLARMSGEYNFVRLGRDGTTPLSSTPLKAELGAFHFILPE